ncbi:MAG: hypothetical protein HN403_18440 [Rhodospirillales bacterium]|jgi:hypothetical protein|nr:hypothetical protein [Rhodospirillales bacterium]
MDDDDLTIGKGRSGNAAVALAEEAARIQQKVSSELREMAATKAAKSEEAAKEKLKEETSDPQARTDEKSKRGAEEQVAAKPENREVPLAPETNTTVDIEA